MNAFTPIRPVQPGSSESHSFDPSRYTAKIGAFTEAYLDAEYEKDKGGLIDFAIASDPALKSMSRESARIQLESYPGVRAIATHKEAHKLYLRAKSGVDEHGTKLTTQQAEALLNEARWLQEAAHSLTGIDIHPGTQIGDCFFVDHATGDVIGETARIGRNTRLYHGVTLGALGETSEGVDRHPYVGDNCVLSMGAKLLGHVVVKNHVSIGPNSQLRGNHLVIADHVKIRDEVRIEDGYKIGPNITIGDGVKMERNPSPATLIEITAEKLKEMGLMRHSRSENKTVYEIPANSIIRPTEDGKFECLSPAMQRWTDRIHHVRDGGMAMGAPDKPTSTGVTSD